MALNIKRSTKEPISEINVTPFVDVMLVLLIIFMVTAPLLTVGVQVDLGTDQGSLAELVVDRLCLRCVGDGFSMGVGSESDRS